MPKFVTKNVWFGYFSAEVWKIYCHIWNQHPRICLIAKLMEKQKCLNLGPKCFIWVILTKNALFWCFWTRIFKKYCHIWNQHSQICLTGKFCKKERKMPKFGTKNPIFAYFWAGILKTFVIFEINTLRFLYLQKFTKKQKYLNLWPKMPYLGIFGLEL